MDYITIDEFRKSTSSFRKYEEQALKIKINETNNIEEIFDKKNLNLDIDIPLKNIILPEFNESNIKTYIPNINDGLTTDQRKFLLKLKIVLINNDPDSQASSCERFLDDLMNFICDKAELDDGLELTLRPCNLYLNIGNEYFAAIADKEGRRGLELTCFIQEDKHFKSSTYKHGDIQLSCAMIAGFQQNYNMFNEIYPKKLLGIKVVADTFYFCSMYGNQKYIEELIEGLPNKSEIIMNKFPVNGLKLSDPKQRYEIIRYMALLKYELLCLEFKPSSF